MRTLPFVLALALACSACSDTAEQANDRAGSVTIYTDPSLSGKDVERQLEAALDNEHVIFLVLVGKDAPSTEKAVLMAQQAWELHEGSVVVRMNRSDKAHEETVETWQLSGVELPAIVVVSAKGIPVGGYPLDEATGKKLAELVPSPKMDDAYVALYEEKPVFLVITDPKTDGKQQLLENCSLAASQLKEKAAVIEVDKADPRERLLLKNFGVKTSSKGHTVVVMNAVGETTDTYKTVPTVQQLKASALKKGTTACCASGESCETPK
jgi:hypothetical protein